VKKIDKLNTKESSGSNNTSEENENKIIEKKNIEMSNPKNRVYINPIKASFTKDELINYFKKCGNIIDTNIDEDNINSSEKVIYIDFKSKNAVNKALKKDGTMFKGEKIRIKDYLESDINIETSQKNIEIKMQDTKIYVDNEIAKIRNYFETKLKETNDKLDKTSKKVKNLNIKLGLTNEIINQSESYNNGRHEYLNSKINMLLNSFKVLYIRKIANLLLEKLLTKYKKKFAKTKEIFGNKVKFGIIIADKDINKISKYKINQLIDFLKHIKKIASQIIHFNNLKKNKSQKQVFYELLKTYLQKKNEEHPGLIETDDIVNILFNKNNESIEEETSEDEIVSKLENKINEYIKEQEKMNSDSDEESSLINEEEGEDANDDDNNEEGIIEEEKDETQQEDKDEDEERRNK
jgi:hypothetical protein